MSCIIYAIVEYEEGAKNESISINCFDFIAYACKKRVAINRVDYLEQDKQYLRRNEMGLDISDSYTLCIAEPFLEADFAAKDPFEGKRLKDLEDVLAYILDLSFVKRIRLYTMKTEEYNEDNFDKIHCPIQGFAEKYKDYFFFNLEDYTTEFIFEKE